jgi:hypothetical protein
MLETDDGLRGTDADLTGFEPRRRPRLIELVVDRSVAHDAEQHDVDACGAILAQPACSVDTALDRDVLLRNRAEPLEARELARDRLLEAACKPHRHAGCGREIDDDVGRHMRRVAAGRCR